MALVDRAPFVMTRTFVECFVKPFTAKADCALWFFVPKKYRRAPDLFLSHSWDCSMWDLRPSDEDKGSKSVWVDTLAVNQHPLRTLTNPNSVAESSSRASAESCCISVECVLCIIVMQSP